MVEIGRKVTRHGMMGHHTRGSQEGAFTMQSFHKTEHLTRVVTAVLFAFVLTLFLSAGTYAKDDAGEAEPGVQSRDTKATSDRSVQQQTDAKDKVAPKKDNEKQEKQVKQSPAMPVQPSESASRIRNGMQRVDRTSQDINRTMRSLNNQIRDMNTQINRIRNLDRRMWSLPRR